MNWYRVLLHGKNVLLNFDGEPKKFGFYTTRDVEAESLEIAELKAVEMVREDEALVNGVLNERDDSPMIYVDEMKILNADEEKLGNSGFTFYVEQNEPS